MNAFLIFCKRHRSQVREKYPHLENRQVTKILGEWWADISAQQKISYTELAKQYKEAFLRANPDFKWYKIPVQPPRPPPARPSNQKVPRTDPPPTDGAITFGKLADEAQMGGLSTLLSPSSSSSCTSVSTTTFPTYISSPTSHLSYVSATIGSLTSRSIESSDVGIASFVCDTRHNIDYTGINDHSRHEQNDIYIAVTDRPMPLSTAGVHMPRPESPTNFPTVDTGQVTKVVPTTNSATMKPPMPRNKRYLQESMNLSAVVTTTANAIRAVGNVTKTPHTTHWKKNPNALQKVKRTTDDLTSNTVTPSTTSFEVFSGAKTTVSSLLGANYMGNYPQCNEEPLNLSTDSSTVRDAKVEKKEEPKVPKIKTKSQQDLINSVVDLMYKNSPPISSAKEFKLSSLPNINNNIRNASNNNMSSGTFQKPNPVSNSVSVLSRQSDVSLGSKKVEPIKLENLIKVTKANNVHNSQLSSQNRTQVSSKAENSLVNGLNNSDESHSKNTNNKKKDMVNPNRVRPVISNDNSSRVKVLNINGSSLQITNPPNHIGRVANFITPEVPQKYISSCGTNALTTNTSDIYSVSSITLKNDRPLDVNLVKPKSTKDYESSPQSKPAGDESTMQDIPVPVKKARPSASPNNKRVGQRWWKGGGASGARSRAQRACKGKRYEEFISEGLLQAPRRSRLRNSNRPEDANKSRDTDDEMDKDLPMEDDNEDDRDFEEEEEEEETNEVDGEGEDVNPASEEKDSENTNIRGAGDETSRRSRKQSQNQNKSDFDLEARIEALPSLSLDDFTRRKRERKRASVPSSVPSSNSNINSMPKSPQDTSSSVNDDKPKSPQSNTLNAVDNISMCATPTSNPESSYTNVQTSTSATEDLSSQTVPTSETKLLVAQTTITKVTGPVPSPTKWATPTRQSNPSFPTGKESINDISHISSNPNEFTVNAQSQATMNTNIPDSQNALSMAGVNSLEASSLSPDAQPLTGSRKRKARKQTITRHDPSDTKLRKDTSVVEPAILSSMQMQHIADVAAVHPMII